MRATGVRRASQRSDVSDQTPARKVSLAATQPVSRSSLRETTRVGQPDRREVGRAEVVHAERVDASSAHSIGEPVEILAPIQIAVDEHALRARSRRRIEVGEVVGPRMSGTIARPRRARATAARRASDVRARAGRAPADDRAARGEHARGKDTRRARCGRRDRRCDSSEGTITPTTPASGTSAVHPSSRRARTACTPPTTESASSGSGVFTASTTR